MQRLGTFALVLAALVVASTPAAANHQSGHGAQRAAKVAFAADFPKLTDSEWGWPLGGFGGLRANAPRKHVPVIFVHGNNTDAGDWYPVRDDFKAAGWTDQELFALSYNGLGGPNGEAATRRNPQAADERAAMGYDGSSRITGNDVNVPDLYAFVKAVQSYTGSAKFSLVSHSLGVTVARKTLKVHPELRADLVAFVGIAGGNHGTSFCPPGSEGELMSCDEIAAGTPWLAALNGPNGSDETYAPAKWMTVYDGSGAGDPAFYGPTYAQSPMLKGADNRQFPGTYHNDLRISAPIVALYRAFLEQAETAVLASAPPAPPGAPAVAGAPRAGAAEAIPATGPVTSPLVGLSALAAVLILRREFVGGVSRAGWREKPSPPR